MSASTAAAAPPLPAPWRAGGSPRAGAPLTLELVLFALLAGFACAQWARLFADRPVGELAGALAICAAAGLAIALLGRTGLSRRLTLALAIVVAVAGTLAAMVAAGLPLRLLAPGNWGELATNVGDGLAGIEDADLPYDGERTWTRLTLLLGAPLLLGVAAASAFWPARRRGPARTVALAALLTIYGMAVTMHSPPSERLWGLPLLILAVAWLWLPAAGWRRGGVVLASAAAVGAVALPVAASLDPERPWWDYESWNWFTRQNAVSFNWNHSYGPLDWPQKGTTLLEARSEQPLYWKTTVLDRFDGFVWQRADPGDALAAAEVTARARASDAVALSQANPEWLLDASFEVRKLRSDFVVGAGTPLAVEGYGAAQRSSDGTLLAGEEPLDAGEEYSIVTYSPQPSANRMRRAPQSYPESAVPGATLVGLPDASVGGSSGFASAPAVEVPLWRERRGPTQRLLATSQYGEMYALARELTGEARTVYDAVISVERHLRENYDYTQNVPERTYPLMSFLFEDAGGYCQQFSGAMALMLRMLGIPARVVSGFAPGSYDAEDDVYEISDTDAHSWVEVYFAGIGWVAFDPTPSAAPAAAQVLEAGGPIVLRRNGAQQQAGGLGRSIEERLRGGEVPAAAAGDENGGSAVGAIIAACIGAVALWLGAGYVRRRARLRGPRAAELQAHELIAALARLGWQLPAGITLRAIELRFAAAGRNPIASYARALGRYRYEAGPARLPGPAERRSLRRALARGGGPRRRWRALRALPPGGPAVQP